MRSTTLSFRAANITQSVSNADSTWDAGKDRFAFKFRREVDQRTKPLFLRGFGAQDA